MSKRQSWTKEKIISELQRLHFEGEDLSAGRLNKQRKALYKACLHHFNSYKEAIESADLNYSSIRKRKSWTKSSVVGELRRLYEVEEDMSSSRLSKDYAPLDHACRRLFGSYRKAIESAGLDYGSIRKYKSWTKETIISELQRLHSEGEDISDRMLSLEHTSLYSSCLYYFGTYEKALISAGLDYSTIRQDGTTASYQGRQLEKLLSELLLELGFSPEEQCRELAQEIRPDFVFKNEAGEVSIFDSKLSEWTHWSSDTIEKYTPHCSTLALVYLRGEKSFTKLDSGAYNISIYFFIDKVKDKKKRKSFTDRADQLWEEADKNENINEKAC